MNSFDRLLNDNTFNGTFEAKVIRKYCHII